MSHARKMVRKNPTRIYTDANQRIIERNERIKKQKAYEEAKKEKAMEAYRAAMQAQEEREKNQASLPMHWPSADANSTDVANA